MVEGVHFVFLSRCVHMYESVILTSHTSLCWLCVCMQVWFKPGNLHKHMHAFCSGSLSTNYWRNLYARRFPAAIRSSTTGSAQNISWLASSPPLSTALVIPLSTYGTFFSFTQSTVLPRKGQLNSMGERKSHRNNTHLSLFLPLSQCMYVSCVWQWYTRVGSKSQRKCIVSKCMCGYESSTKKVHCVNPTSAEAIPPCIVGVFASPICMTYCSPLVLKY